MKRQAGVGPNKKEGWAGDDWEQQKGIEWTIARMELAINEWCQRKRPRNWLSKYGDLYGHKTLEGVEDGYVYELFKVVLDEVVDMAPRALRPNGVGDHSDPVVYFTTHNHVSH